MKSSSLAFICLISCNIFAQDFHSMIQPSARSRSPLPNANQTNPRFELSTKNWPPINIPSNRSSSNGATQQHFNDSIRWFAKIDSLEKTLNCLASQDARRIASFAVLSDSVEAADSLIKHWQSCSNPQESDQAKYGATIGFFSDPKSDMGMRVILHSALPVYSSGIFEFTLTPKLALNLNTTKADSEDIENLTRTGFISNQLEPIPLTVKISLGSTGASAFANLSPIRWNMMSIAKIDSTKYSAYSFVSSSATGGIAFPIAKTIAHIGWTSEYFWEDQNALLAKVQKNWFHRMNAGVEVNGISIELLYSRLDVEVKKNTIIKLAYTFEK